MTAAPLRGQDLTYLPVEDRATSLAHIDAAMKRIGDRIRKGIRGSKVTSATLEEANVVSKHFVALEGVTIKIDQVTPVLRGCAYEPEIRPVSARVVLSDPSGKPLRITEQYEQRMRVRDLCGGISRRDPRQGMSPFLRTEPLFG